MLSIFFFQKGRPARIPGGAASIERLDLEIAIHSPPDATANPDSISPSDIQLLNPPQNLGCSIDAVASHRDTLLGLIRLPLKRPRLRQPEVCQHATHKLSRHLGRVLRHVVQGWHHRKDRCRSEEHTSELQ